MSKQAFLSATILAQFQSACLIFEEALKAAPLPNNNSNKKNFDGD